ncbi:MAG: hypothetical protein AB9886_02040 [Candidatus Cryosericum sp.]
MSWFRRDDASLGDVRSKKAVEQAPKSPVQSLPAEAQDFLDNALQKQKESYTHMKSIQSPRESRRLGDFVKERTVQTIREWFTVEDKYLGAPNPEVYVLVSSGTCGKPEQILEDRLAQGDVYNWVDHWDFKGILVHQADADALKAVPHDIDGAVEHRRRIEKLREGKRKMEESDRELREGVELDELINRLQELAKTPVAYTSESDVVVAVVEESMYSGFAAQLRQYGVDESTVFDMVAELSTLVEQSHRILPRLTPEAAKQFKARVLLSYYENRRHDRSVASEAAMIAENQERARADAERERQIASLETQGELQEITHQLSSLNSSISGQAHDVSRIKWLDMIDGLLGH